MAATVVSVVIFLCGVLVGRGVRAERTAVSESTTVSAPELGLPPQGPASPPPAGSDPTVAAPPPTVDDLSYFNRLEKANPQAEELKAAAPKPAPSAPEKEPPVAAAAAPTAGYVLQIAALRERREADAIARRLESKGYEAYVVAPADGTPAVYRVRIGRFKSRREAETMAAKLRKEEQFNPWITR